MSTTHITIEHRVVAAGRSYEQVIQALEAQLGPQPDLDKLQQALRTTNPSWEQIVQSLEQLPGTSGFILFSTFDLGALLTVGGKHTRAVQYVIGNPLLAIQMVEYAPEAALYAPFRLVVYEDRAGTAFVAYERFTSQLAQYPNPEIAPVARLVEQKLEALVAEATGAGQGGEP